MPVRIAVRELVAEKLLKQLDNGRFDVNPTKLASRKQRPAEAAPVPPVNPQQTVMRDLLERSLRGDDAPLRIVACAQRYGISHSLLHTIFHRLAGVGLIEHAPRIGWTVRPFRQRDLDAYVDVREALERLALDTARERLEVERLRALLALNQAGAKTAGIDNSLHAYWVEKSGNRYIQDFFQRHQPYYDLLLDHAVVKRQHIELSKASHRAILEALIRRDWPAAHAELSRDIRRLSPLLKETIRRLEPA
jgi:DNA-binding GntR family transcriptional regulator